MEIKEMTLEQVTERRSAILEELENATNIEAIDALGLEAEELDKRANYIKEAVEKRQALEAEVRSATNVKILETRTQGDDKMEQTVYTIKSPEYRSAWAKSLMGLPLEQNEQRALGVALTTTSDTYVPASAEADGVNNAGLFIPEGVMMDLMNRIELVSPFLADVPKTAVKGYAKFPYRVSGTGAKAQVEGVANTDGQVQWAELVLTVGEISETIPVTWKLEAMSVEGFIKYIVDELAFAVGEKIADGVLYGDGDDDLTGVTVGALDGSYTIGALEGNVADIFEAISAGIALITDKRKRQGIKIYVASDVYQSMAFARDGEDRFLHNPINGVGIESLAKFKVEEDPFLNAGEFLIGNARFYKFNWNEQLTIARDSSGKKRINEYTGYALCSGKAEPSSFVHGKKSA